MLVSRYPLQDNSAVIDLCEAHAASPPSWLPLAAERRPVGESFEGSCWGCEHTLSRWVVTVEGESEVVQAIGADDAALVWGARVGKPGIRTALDFETYLRTIGKRGELRTEGGAVAVSVAREGWPS